MKHTRLSLISLFLLVSLLAHAVDLNTYYANARGKKGRELKTALCNIIYRSSATTSYDGLLTAYTYTDKRADGTIWDMYSCITHYRAGSSFCSQYSNEGDGYNREHTIPQSVFSERAPMKSDLFHVYPTDAKMNGVRSNYCHGDVGTVKTASAQNFCYLGTPSATLQANGCTEQYVFEVDAQYKGDVARTYFYFVTCYENQLTSFGSYGAFSHNTYPSLTTWAQQCYMAWSQSDPVSDKETVRNEAVYNYPDAGSNNRNPFIDFPGLEQYIWGTYKDVAFDPADYVNPYDGTHTGGGDTGEGENTGGGEGGEDGDNTNPDTPGSGGDTPGQTTPSEGGTVYYERVSSEPEDWSGTYLIVYEQGQVALDGALTALDAAGNTVEVTISQGRIAGSEAMDASSFTIAPSATVQGAYTLCSASGKYIGNTANSNSLATQDAATLTNMLSIDSKGVLAIKASGGSYLRFNNATDQKRFRYYKSGSYTSQQAIALYRRVVQAPAILPGDVDGSGDVSLRDLTLLVAYLLSADTPGVVPQATDVDGRDGCTPQDVQALVQILLRQQ